MARNVESGVAESPATAPERLLTVLVIDQDRDRAERLAAMLTGTHPATGPSFEVSHVTPIVAPPTIERLRPDACIVGPSLQSPKRLGPIVHAAAGAPVVAVAAPTGPSREALLSAGAADALVDDDQLGPDLVERTVRFAIERQRADRALAAERARFRAMVDGSQDGLWDWDLRRSRVTYSDGWEETIGVVAAELGHSIQAWFSRVHPVDRVGLRVAINDHLQARTGHLEAEHRVRHADGSYRWMLAKGRVVRDATGTAQRLVGSLVDITRVRRAEERLSHFRYHDELTGLPNRKMLTNRLAAAQSRGDQTRCAVIVFDVDGLRIVNESQGRRYGDELLVTMARRLEEGVRSSDTVARLEGDEFGVLLEGVHGLDEAVHAAHRLQALCREPLVLGDEEVMATMSAGVAIDGRGRDLLNAAGSAMYRARRHGRGRVEVEDHTAAGGAATLLRLDTDLLKGLEREEFVVHYQPIVDLRAGNVVGLEALVRWHHPNRGLLQPSEFVPRAETNGMIVAIDRWVLARAAADARRWRSHFARPDEVWPTVSVNLSARHFTAANLPDLERAVAAATGPDQWLALEVTEGVLLEETNVVIGAMERLKRRRVSLHVDDFGSGYSSLGYLHRLPVDSLKIDRTFIADLRSDDASASIVKSVLDLADGLGISVVAEGIEHMAQLDTLIAMGCRFGQGFLFAAPLAADEIAEVIGSGGRLARGDAG
jgi:diguanylate cyclase (GGDEF)-like protein/PAS domain S-box-containing protein